MNSTNWNEPTEGLHAAEAQQFEQVSDGLAGMKRGPVESIWDRVMALWNLLCDSTASWADRAVALTALVYLVVPFDVIPDFLPGGLADDVAVILAAVAALAVRIYQFQARYSTPKV